MLNDIKYNKSEILASVNEFMRQQIGCPRKDFMILDLLYSFVGNLACENKVIAEKVLKETCMVEGLRSILEYEQSWPSQFLNTVCWMI